MKRWLAILLFPAFAHASWVDGSITDLLPPSVSRSLEATSRFPLFWWNFVVVEAENVDPDFSKLDPFCQSISARTEVRKSACGLDLRSYAALLQEWSRDQFLRQPPPTEETLHRAFDESLAKASLPMGDALLSILRSDPLESYRDLIDLSSGSLPIDLPRVQGYFFDSVSRRVLIPVQFSFPPFQSRGTAAFLDAMESPVGWKILGLTGIHASTLENERRVYADVDLVGTISAVLMGLLVCVCIYLRRSRLIWLAPPVLLSSALSVVVTILVFGRIHGLTLAFGPGIVGLALDHGLHSCLNIRWRGAWRANFYGLITTLAGLVVFLASSVPFLRQLMFFSTTGLVLGFICYWWLHRRYPQVFAVEPLFFEPHPSAWKCLAATAVIGGIAVGAGHLHADFGMRQMQFQTAASEQLTKWTISHTESRAPLLQIGSLEESVAILKSTSEKKVSVRSATMLLPPIEEQRVHLQNWTKLCSRSWTAEQQKFFEPFFAACREARVQTLEQKVPAYLQDFTADGRWLTLWQPRDQNEEAMIRSSAPNALSLRELADRFPAVLGQELAWMAPLGILMAVFFLWNYYRDGRYVLAALIPFFSGVGFYFWMAVCFSYSFSFVSLIGMVMVFGLSLDYGIFAVNLYTGQLDRPSGPGVWTSVLLAASVTMIGFGPLILCRHPVLAHLGQVLFWGTAGTVLGCVWGVPGFHWLAQASRRQSGFWTRDA